MAKDLNEEVARRSGFLLVTVAGKTVELPRLKIKQARAWKRTLSEADIELTDGGPLLADELDRPVDVILDLILAYDVTGVLGDRDYLETQATDVEVNDIFEAVLEATFPFVREVPLAGTLGRMVVMALLNTTRSTSGPSPTGDSTPTDSKSDSPTTSSGSSGTPVSSD